jgi:hypothetical protein
MKRILLLMAAGFSWVAGCASTPVALQPVGPNPLGNQTTTSQGHLQVFSRLSRRSDDQNQSSSDPIWYQHTGYRVYTLDGKLAKRVDNTAGHYRQAPRTLALPPGRYLVQAQAADYFEAEVPVTIELGRTTRVHLDDQWQAPASVAKSEVVSLPNGMPVGWSVQSTKG